MSHMQCKKSKSNILHCVSRMQFKDSSTAILQGATCEQHAIFNQQKAGFSRAIKDILREEGFVTPH